MGNGLSFERLLSDISARFLAVPSHEFDREIVDAQRRLCECLGLDRSFHYQLVERTPPRLMLTHMHGELGAPKLPVKPNPVDYFPWVTSQVFAGKVVAVADIEALPPEAAVDRQTFAHFGQVKSALALPLFTGGGPVIGVLAFDTIHRHCGWPAELVLRCELVAQVFANALARKQADLLLRESEERYRSIAQDLPGVVYQFYAREDGRWGMTYVDKSSEQICGLPSEPLVQCLTLMLSYLGLLWLGAPLREYLRLWPST
jgi:PAS domain-containing protein